MIKSILALLISLVVASAFAPNPIVGTKRISLARNKNVENVGPLCALPFLKKKEPILEETTEDETADDINANVTLLEEECEIEEELSETQKMMQQVKDAGIAGIISYAAWEWAFWAISVPVCVVGYRQVTGHWPDLSDSDDLSKLGAEAFAFVNFARFAVPLRIGLALGTTPWVQENIVDRFMKKEEDNCES